MKEKFKILESKDIFTWEIIYNDGTNVLEFNEIGQKINTYPGAKINTKTNDFEDEKDFEQYEKIACFRIYWIKDVFTFINSENNDKYELKPFASINIPLLSKLIWRRRTLLDGNTSNVKARVFLLGWRKIEKGIIYESILYISISLNAKKQINMTIHLGDAASNIDYFKFEQFQIEQEEDLSQEMKEAFQKGVEIGNEAKEIRSISKDNN